MKKNGIVSLLFLIPLLSGFNTHHYFIASASAAVDLGFNGTLVHTTCDVRMAASVLQMEPVGIDEFTRVGKVSTYSKPLTLYVENCQASPVALSKVNLSFDALTAGGKAAPGAFINQAKDASQATIDNGVGYAVYDKRDDSNVLTTAGDNRLLTYPVTISAPLQLPREFYVKYMQTGQTVTAGQVEATLLVSAYYD